MELSEQLTAITTERNQYKEMVDNLAAEVFSLDKALVKSYQENVASGKDLYLLNKSITDLNNQIQALLNEKKVLHEEKIILSEEINDLKNTLHRLGSDAQSIEG